jgi:RNA polymerase sigma factor (sigma-70 family)
MATNPMSQVIQHVRGIVLPREGVGLTDAQLLTRFIERRDEAAFATLLRRHGPMVRSVCRRVLGNDHDADDAFQASFLVLVRKAASVVPRDMIANWLYGVAHTTALRAKVLAAKRSAREKQVREMPEPDVAPLDHRDDLRHLLDRELSRLPDKYRVPIVLCDLEDRSIKEAARQLGWPQGTVAGRLARARVMLAKRLAPHVLLTSGGVLATLLSRQEAPASVPTSLVTSTIDVAKTFAAGQVVSGAISAPVAALTEGVLKAMFVSKLEIVPAILLVVSLTALGGGLLATHGSAAQQRNKASAQNGTQDNVKTLLDVRERKGLEGDHVYAVGFVDSGTVPAKDKGKKKPDTAVTDLERMQGVWSVVSMNGHKLSKREKSVFMVDGKRACWQTKDGEIQGGLYLDPSKDPKTYDLATSTRTMEGIYSLEGDTLRLCYSPSIDEKRPSRFAAERGSHQVLVVLQRTHGRDAFPFRLSDGTRAFPTFVEKGGTPQPPVPQAIVSEVPIVAKTTTEYEINLVTPEPKRNVLLPSGPLPRQALVSLDKKELVVRTLVVFYEPVTVNFQGKPRTSYQQNEVVKTNHYSTEMIEVYDVQGKSIAKKRLAELLKKETLALVSTDPRAADPLNLRLFKEGTLLFVLPSATPPPPPIDSLLRPTPAPK